MFPKDCPRGVLEHAEELAKQLRWVESDEDIDPSQPFPLFCAQLRHHATNYDEVLGDLAYYCSQCVEANGACPLELDELEEITQWGYITIKGAANDLVHRLIQRRQNKEVEAKVQP